jgi:probable F420-dependent oxidoreductase
MAHISRIVGIAMPNFTAYPAMPDAQALIEYGERMEALGFESVWVWDHVLLGVDPCFPIIDSLTLLTAVAARTSRIRLGTGILVLPARNPVLLAKQTSSLDQIAQGRLTLGMASGWYKREFDALGVPFNRRGRIMDQSLEILDRLWREDRVDATYEPYMLRDAVMYPKPYQKPRPQILIGGYVDRVLKRAATKSDGWLTYFYTPADFVHSWDKVRRFAEEAGRDPDTLVAINQLPIMIGGSRAELHAPMMEWLSTEWDFASWSDSKKESAVLGTVDDCIEQLQAHLAAGVHKLILVPYRYDEAQIRLIAEKILPALG